MIVSAGNSPYLNAWISYRWRFVAAGCLSALLSLMAVANIRGWGIFERPPVRVAFNQFAPYLERGPHGIPVGFAAEVFMKAARNAKIEIRWVEIQGSADRAFTEGKADMYPLMTITPERESEFYMSAPWWENQFALVSAEGREIPDAAASKGKIIATRIGLIQTLSQRLFPHARYVDMLTVEEMETALCNQQIDGFFSDVRLLQIHLMRRPKSCAGQAFRAISVPGSRLFLGTASTKAAASANDKIFHEIAKLVLDGTLSQFASKSGIFTPYDTARLKQVVDAEARETLMAWVLAGTLLVLALSVIQTNLVRRAKRRAESAQAQAKEMNDRFNEFMKHTPTITFIKDERGRIVYSNEESSRSGSTADFCNHPGVCQQLSHGDEEILESGRGVEVMETLPDQNGAEHHFLVLKFPFRGGTGSKLLGGVALDVTARILAERELEKHARNDLLTGLPNRRSFMAELGRALHRSLHRAERLAVGFVDLDGFKRVNDLLGHEAGDELLKLVAARLKQVCGESDMVARLGGDEFTFLLPAISPVGGRQAMSAVLSELEAPFWIDGKEVAISASIGMSHFPEHGSTPQQLLRNADSAMYCAKRNGKGRIEVWSKLLETDQTKILEAVNGAALSSR